MKTFWETKMDLGLHRLTLHSAFGELTECFMKDWKYPFQQQVDSSEMDDKNKKQYSL